MKRCINKPSTNQALKAGVTTQTNASANRPCVLRRSASDVGCWSLDVGCWMFDVGCWMLDVGCWMHASPVDCHFLSTLLQVVVRLSRWKLSRTTFPQLPL